MSLNENSFYTIAGMVAGKKFPEASIVFKKRFINGFKRFVDSSGGPESFRSAANAIEQYCSTQFKRGGKRAH